MCAIYVAPGTVSCSGRKYKRIFRGYYGFVLCGNWNRSAIGIFYMAFSKYGKIKLGDIERPEYSNFKWGTMILRQQWQRIFYFIPVVNGLYMLQSNI